MLQSRFLKLLGAVTAINIIARLFGFFREVFIGYQYGTSYQADSIITAFTIPNFLYLVLGGAVTTAFISVYSKLTGTRKNDFASTMFTVLTTVVGVLTILFMLFPAFWMELFFSGMSAHALELSSNLFVITAPSTLFLVVGIALSGLHNVNGNYRLSTFSTLFFNGIYLVIGAGLTPWLMAYSYAIGATLGAAIMCLFLIYYMFKLKLMPLKPKMVRMSENTRFIKLALPLVLGGATMQFYLLIQRMFASSLNDGGIAVLNYASKMTQFPQAVLMASVTTIVYPMLAKAAGEGDAKRISEAYKKGFRLLTLILIPASLFILIYAEDIITFIFQYGHFNQNSTNATYPLLQIYAAAIASLALNTYITRFFYALEKTVLPVVLNVFSIFGINILVIVIYIDEFGPAAIALGTVISAIVNMLLLMICAKWKLGLKVSNLGYIIKLIPYTLVSGFALWAVSMIPLMYVLVSLICGTVALSLIIGSALKFVR
ncbi:lipid II flippase MurJ [Lentibacillus kapialis]|uniref:Lipid II flippase MurJ n=1 Tax=Lentibacillus kapialis TaxID=340214 RepID=A0A917Q108_9BACI|nr:murein biosynthesis integral membrane protein MurJ [Lentibacillus kapialis]GGK04680.1 lipid II flippase MurJ [Lentibacillus kapialis]